MNCPICKVALLVSNKHGIEIEYCPKCTGIWSVKHKLSKTSDKKNHYNIRNSKDYISDSHHFEKLGG